MSTRPVLVKAPEEAKRMSALLAGELLQWPGVVAKPMFGLRAFYLGSVIFAMLPDKQAFKETIEIAYKLASVASKREGEKWRRFALADEQHLSAALACLRKAYEQAG